MKNDDQITEKLLAYVCGELTADETTAVEKRLTEDAGLRRLLLEISTEEAALNDWAKTERVVIDLDDSAFEAERVPAVGTAGEARSNWNPWMAIAAALAILAAINFLRPVDSKPEQLGVTQIVASVDAVWEGVQPEANESLVPGEYRLAGGSIELVFADGAEVSMSGPTEFHIRGGSHLHLVSGNLVAHIPDEALGFVATTPQSEVVDLGTEFGLSVSDDGRTDVHALDGLVKVLPMDNTAGTDGILVTEGQARRFESAIDADPQTIPVSSRKHLLRNERSGDSGLKMLRGSVRLREQFSSADFDKRAPDRNWIEIIPEQRGVTLKEALAVTIDTPGNYRDFSGDPASLPEGTRVDSYILHFLPNNLGQVRGVIRFDRPVVAVLCVSDHLRATDGLVGLASVQYPQGRRPNRGLEPSRSAVENRAGSANWVPDELILSQDRTTVAIRAFANTERGVDQVRILTLSK
jgi:hypothetical protein